MIRRWKAAGGLVAAAVLVGAGLAGPAASAQAPVVRAVLFFSPTCGHCEHVVNDFLFPVWFPEYGGEAEVRFDEALGDQAAFYLATNGSLEVLLTDVTVLAGAELFMASNGFLGLPDEQRGVPRLVVGDRYLIGSAEIPDEFPGIVEAGLTSGGIDWPAIAGLPEALAGIPAGEPTTTTTAPTTTTVATTTTTAPATSTSAAGSTTTGMATTTTMLGETSTTSPGAFLPVGGGSWWDRFQRDETANSLALVVLGLMLLSLAGVAWYGRSGSLPGGPGLAVPLLALVGLGVAAYLAFVEVGGSQAVCGPVGDCNAVQDSEWARLFGVIHVGIIGVAGYVAVLAAWVVARFGPARLADGARVALLAGVAAGVGFSIYLTFLEPFVIGATCLWCLGSAVIVTVLLWLTARPGVAAWRRLRERGPAPR